MFAGECTLCSVSDFVLFRLHSLSELNNNVCIMDRRAAPVYDLREALKRGRLGNLNPVPWAVMTGNCLGWAAYGYYTKDPFVLASNMPGLVLSFWLNSGAAKLQYYEIMNDLKEGENNQDVPGNETVVTVRQETLMLRILVVWVLILVWAGWLQHFDSPAHIIGLCVNVNLGENGAFRSC